MATKSMVYLLLILGLVFTGSGARADSETGLSYNISFPTGETNNFIGKASFLGFDYETTWREKSKPWGFGFALRWTHFEENPGVQTIDVGGASITGDQSRAIDAFPILPHARYYFDSDSLWKPYASLGLGPIYMNRQLRIGGVIYDRSGWQFGLAPEIGVSFFPKDQFNSYFFGVRYERAYSTGSLPDYANWAFFVGIKSSL